MKNEKDNFSKSVFIPKFIKLCYKNNNNYVFFLNQINEMLTKCQYLAVFLTCPDVFVVVLFLFLIPQFALDIDVTVKTNIIFNHLV